MNENIITWNFTNLITVGLMAILIYFLVGLILKARQNSKTPATVSTTGARGLS